jgi:hypothetical protein
MRRPARTVQRSLTSKRLIYLIAGLALPTVIGISIAAALWKTSYPANVSLNLAVSRFTFQLESASVGDELVRSLPVDSLGMSNIETVEFDARRVRMGDLRLVGGDAEIYKSATWKSIDPMQPKVVFQAKEEPSLPFVRIKPERSGTLALDPIRVNVHSQVDLEVPEESHNPREAQAKAGAFPPSNFRPTEIRITVPLKDGIFHVDAKGIAYFQTRECHLAGSSLNSSVQPGNYAVELDPRNSQITIATRSGPVDFLLVPTSDIAQSLLSAGTLLLSHPRFLRSIPNVTPQKATDFLPYVSSLLPEADNRLTYLDFPTKGIEHFARNAILYIGDDAILNLTHLSVSPTTGGLDLELQGRVLMVATKSASGEQTYRMNRLESVEYALGNSPLRLVFVSSTWLATTTLGAYKLIKELRKEFGK